MSPVTFPNFRTIDLQSMLSPQINCEKTQTKPHDTLRRRCWEETLPRKPGSCSCSSQLAKPRATLPHLATPSWYFRFPIAEQWQMKGKKTARVVIWGTQGYMWQKTQEPKNQRRLLQIFAGKPDRP